MHNVLNIQTLEQIGARFAILSVSSYAMPVRFRIRDGAVECRVPTWSGIGDLLDELTGVILVAQGDSSTEPYWLFIRGTATLIPNPNWAGLEPLNCGKVDPDDLYQLLRIAPRRIELIDERRGWGYRETVDY